MNPDHGYVSRPIDYKRDPIYFEEKYKFVSKDIFERLFLPLFKLYGTIFSKRWQMVTFISLVISMEDVPT